MKILHTADWHIGKQLYKYPLTEDLLLFFDELISIIEAESINILLISGDIFDLSNPSNEDRKLYFSFLNRLRKHNLHIIITAGNHDSARMIDGPRELFEALNIHVVGEGSSAEDQLLSIPSGEKNSEPLLIAAIPYLRERDIRNSIAGEMPTDKENLTRQGIVDHYQLLFDMAYAKNKNACKIAMGHLYIYGVKLSDSEREIQVGNLAGISSESLDIGFDYVALGHIHKPQIVHKDNTIMYSGSPIALSFSERKDEKRVIVLTVENNKVSDTKIIPLTLHRRLKKFEGTVDEIRAKLESYEQKAALPTYIEVHAHEEKRDSTKQLELVQLSDVKSEFFKIVNKRISFTEKAQYAFLASSQKNIEELSPLQVFEERLKDSNENDSLKKELKELYLEILEDLQEQGK